MRRAYFVMGAEGSGNHMMAEALRSSGCFEDERHGLYMEDYEFEKMPDLFVFWRSLPHAYRFPDLIEMKAQLEVAGFEVVPILMIRDWYCTMQSVIRRNYQHDPHLVQSNMRMALRVSIEAFPDSLTYVSYESFCHHSEFRAWLFEQRFGLPAPTSGIFYSNPRYYRDEENYIDWDCGTTAQAWKRRDD